MNILLIILLFFTQCSPSKNDKDKTSEKEVSTNQIVREKVLYKKSNSSEEDEYLEGGYYLYDKQDRSSSLLFDRVLIDYSEAWRTINDDYVIFTLSSIILLNEQRELIERFNFKETELVLGALYNKHLNKIYFLLKDTESNKVDLCQFSFDNQELKKVIEGTSIQSESIEEPFKKMFFVSDNQLLIQENCYDFWIVNLKDYSIDKTSLDKGSCNEISMVQNRKGIVYVKYMDSLKTNYELREYNFTTQKNKLLLDGRNEYFKPVSLKLFSVSDESPFLVQIDNKLFLYDYSSFNEVKVDAKEILNYSEGYLIYINSLEEVKATFTEG